MKTETIKIEWGMRQEMSSLILLLRDGDYEGQNYASERLMDLADQIDEINNQNQDDE
tara:strand:- start:1348 stop:1518 length:171 start_codon:yes stop_codon:yes gene_type:complete